MVSISVCYMLDPNLRRPCFSRSFSKQWWFAYLYTGAMLGCVMSVKFVGLFVVLVVGLYAALDLWQKLGELDRPLVWIVVFYCLFDKEIPQDIKESVSCKLAFYFFL